MSQPQNNEGDFKLIDLIVEIPEGLTVTNVTAGSRLVGGKISYNLASDGKLRIVYFDANANSVLTVSGETFPIELFNITFSVTDVTAGDVLDIAISEMSLKLTSDSTDEDSKVEIETEDAEGSVMVVEGRTFSAGVLYEGDGIDLIPAGQKAIVVTVTALEGEKKLTYRHGDEVFENMYPRIVPKEIFDRVRIKINANKYGKRSVEVVYLLRHKLKCGYCGQPISAECGTSKTGAKKRYYKCFGRKNHNGCKKSMMRKDQLEGLIVSTIIDELSKPKTLDHIVAGLLEEQERHIKEHSMLNVLLREQRQVESSIENVMAAIERGVITNTTTKRLKELEARQEELDKRRILRALAALKSISMPYG